MAKYEILYIIRPNIEEEAKNVSLWMFSKAAFSETKSFGFCFSKFAKSSLVSALA